MKIRVMSEPLCLCCIIRPLLFLVQYFGLIPLKVVHESLENGKRTGNCKLEFHWKSSGAISNTILGLFFICAFPFSYAEIRQRLSNVYEGTDLYAFTFQTMAMVAETIVLLLTGRIFKKSFTKGWASLHEVYHSMCDAADDLGRIRIWSFVAAVIIFLEAVIFYIFNVVIINVSRKESKGFYDSGVALFFGTLYLTTVTIFPYILSTFFLFISLIIRSHFIKIAEMLKTIISAKQKNEKLAARIDSLRVLHEQLCMSVQYFEDFFGIQILFILCIACFTGTIGAYACILVGEGGSSQRGREILISWGVHLYSATIFIFSILISGQMVINSAVAPARILNSLHFVDLDEKSQVQVQAFLQKISAFPTKMQAAKITTVSASFLASAATNMITYLLVLMQFKLGLEKTNYENPSIMHIPQESNSFTNSTNIFETSS